MSAQRPLGIRLPVALALLGPGLSLLASCSGASEVEAATVTPGPVLPNEPLEAYRAELLELAYEAASAFPVFPHIKTRSRAQERIVETCLALDQPGKALAYLGDIQNWRKGAAYASLAAYLAERGETKHVAELLEEAERVIELSTDELQDWRLDRIRAGIARVHLLMGDGEKAAQLEAGLVSQEVGGIQSLRARIAEEDTFDEEIQFLDEMADKGDLNHVKNGLGVGRELFDRYYADEKRRNRVVSSIMAHLEVPPQLRIEALIDLADVANEHQDAATAEDLANKARGILEGTTWNPEDKLPLLAKLARVHFESGNEQRGRDEAFAVLAAFEAQREQIVDGFRCETLLPLAETYEAMGDTENALKVYMRAAEEGSLNVNARPRAEDLADLCRSMAARGVEPHADLWSKLKAVRKGLVEPW